MSPYYNPETLTEIGVRFRARLDQLGLSVSAAIRETPEAGLTEQAVWNYTHTTVDPHGSSLVALATLARCSVDYLLGRG